MNDYVKWIQKSLISLGYDPGQLDGIYGSRTKKAVVAFQKNKQLFPDGIVGEQTHKALLTAFKAKSLYPKDSEDKENKLKNFTADEFKCSCGCGLDVVTDLKVFAQSLRDHFGWPLTISSGARCPPVNKAAGGVADSCHLSGQAFDCYFAGHMNGDLLAAMAAFALAEGVGVIRYPQRLFCHFQTYPRNSLSY